MTEANRQIVRNIDAISASARMRRMDVEEYLKIRQKELESDPMYNNIKMFQENFKRGSAKTTLFSFTDFDIVFDNSTQKYSSFIKESKLVYIIPFDDEVESYIDDLLKSYVETFMFHSK